jgi:superoxide reductase
MAELKEQLQSGEWKTEKHVPVIDCPDTFKKAETICLTVAVGKEIPHPNTSAHHIEWIDLYFLPEGEKFSYQIGRFECSAHGASIQGPDTSTLYTNPSASVEFKTDKPGTVMAASYCNIHGLWQYSKKIRLQK